MEKKENTLPPLSPLAVVTGANGFVGSHLVDWLLQKNYRVHCVVRGGSNLRWLAGKNIKLHKCGLGEVEALRAVFKDADYLYHIAGVVASNTPEGYIQGNVDTTRIVLDAAIGAPNLKRVIVTSSLAASAPTKPGKPVTEATPSAPLTAYGRSKVLQENLCKEYMNRLPITIIRPPAVYGERDTEVLLFFKTIKKGLLPLLGFDNKTLSLVYVRDLVRGMEMAATSPKAVGNTYFLTSGNEYTWKQLGQTVSKAIGKKAFAVRVPHFVVKIAAASSEWLAALSGKSTVFNREKCREIVQASWACSSEKASQDFGYQSQVSLEEGIGLTAEWYKGEGWI